MWASALRTLSDAIAAGFSPHPTSVDLWSQYVSADELLHIADNSYKTPLAITLFGDQGAGVRVPTGEPIDLPITWHFQVDLAPLDTVERTRVTELFRDHNATCCDQPIIPTETAR